MYAFWKFKISAVLQAHDSCETNGREHRGQCGEVAAKAATPPAQSARSKHFHKNEQKLIIQHKLAKATSYQFHMS